MIISGNCANVSVRVQRMAQMMDPRIDECTVFKVYFIFYFFLLLASPTDNKLQL